MPDDSDYAALAEMLARPLSWTPEEEALVRWQRKLQQERVEYSHHLDHAGRARLERVVAKFDRAIAKREAGDSRAFGGRVKASWLYVLWRFHRLGIHGSLLVSAIVIGCGLGVPYSIYENRFSDLLWQFGALVLGIGFFLLPWIVYKRKARRQRGAHTRGESQPPWTKRWAR